MRLSLILYSPADTIHIGSARETPRNIWSRKTLDGYG